MKDKNIAKTLNSTRKVTNWLNSEEGLDWVNERKENPTVLAIGMFL